ncbi:MAG: TIGR04438 family Trp-rich protein [Leptothrix ochracea]|uniref:TIGR04438 family Trp-rich protein n=1 Tax=Leptothrix ochracea TaxID=735331 RepID=UPI0034E2E25E
MLFVLISAILIVLKLLDIVPVALWPWWWILSPLGIAILWWSWSDKSGRTERKAMEEHESKRKARRKKSLQALGMGGRHHKKD